MAGQLAETFVLLRSCLEHAGYGFAMHKNPELAFVWLKRHDDERSKRASIQEFQINKIRQMVEGADKDLAAGFHQLYDRMIDFGAHPNERAITANLKMTDDKKKLLNIYFHGEGIPLENGLKNTAEVGLCCLLLFQHAFVEKFLLLGVRDTLQTLVARGFVLPPQRT